MGWILPNASMSICTHESLIARDCDVLTHTYTLSDIMLLTTELQLIICLVICVILKLHCVFAGSCSELKVEAYSNSDITEHSQDSKIRSYLCTVCHKRYTSPSGLYYHSKIHTGKNVYSCPQCEKRFSSQSYLYSHTNIHTGKYKCTECGKCCQSRGCLDKHRRSHSGEKPFECTVCSKRFTTSHDIIVHSRIHSGEKPYYTNVTCVRKHLVCLQICTLT